MATESALEQTRAENEFLEENLDPNRWKALFVIAISQLMLVLDASIVNLAIPRAKADLGISDVNQQWIITAYTLSFGGLLLLGGRVADYMGRKKALMLGLIGFAAASAIGGIATSSGMLFAARALQGVFGALLAPAALSLITVNFTLPKERAKAFGVFGAISGGGAAIGLLLGGTLTEFLSWRWCLTVNVPISIVAAVLASMYVRESKATKGTTYDIPGAVSVTLGLLSLVYGFTKAAQDGWGASITLTFFAIALALLTTFVYIELKSPSPLLPMRVVLDRNRAGSYLSSLVVGAGLFSMFLFLGLYLQVILGYTPLHAGVAFLPFSIGIILSAGAASNLLPRVGPKPLMTAGLIVAGFGLVMLTNITPTTSYWTHVFPYMLVMSTGLAFVFIPLSSTALHGIGHEDAGVASAMINTSQQVGGSLGTALLNTIASTATVSYMTSNGLTKPDANAFTHGYVAAFWTGSALLALGVVMIIGFIRIGKESLVETSTAHIG
mgnify:FL=1